MKRPHLFLSPEQAPGLRTVDDVRAGIREGHAGRLWDDLAAKVDRESADDPWTPESPLPDRSPDQVRHANREYDLVAMTSNRILDAALVALIREDRKPVDSLLGQLRSLYDVAEWPEIEDETHLAHGDHCSLRRGQLAVAIGLAYDWAHPILRADERRFILDGFHARFTNAFRASLHAGDRWVNWRQNFCSCIYGGFAIAGMAFADDYRESEWLVDTGRAAMDDYLGRLFGPEGEFNESVQYAGSAAAVTDYLMAERAVDPTSTRSLTDIRFDAFCRWYMYFTLPPGRVAGFGDPRPDMQPVVFHYAALASALRDPVFQWYYLQYADRSEATHRRRALELLAYDPTLEPESPDGRMPLGRAYPNRARLISSRSSWDPDDATSVVYAKAARESNHGHADWGQICLDGHGERLLIDLGSPPGYPRTDRHRYYNYQQYGHNVFVFGDGETGGISLAETDRAGDVTFAEFDDASGSAWRIDLSAVYDDVHAVTRTVLHLFPRTLVVLDDAHLVSPSAISLRWHTPVPPALDDDGTLAFSHGRAALSGLIHRLDGTANIAVGHHAYASPYDRNALGDPYEQRHEPFVELTAHDDRCRVISLFCVEDAGDDPGRWERRGDGWEHATKEGVVRVTLVDDELTAFNDATGSRVSAPA